MPIIQWRCAYVNKILMRKHFTSAPKKDCFFDFQHILYFGKKIEVNKKFRLILMQREEKKYFNPDFLSKVFIINNKLNNYIFDIFLLRRIIHF